MTEMQKRLLRVNLTSGEIKWEAISPEDTRKFLGGRVLGDIYLYRELALGIDPLSPQNKLFFGSGPLTGTSAPGSSRYIVHTKSPLTGLYNSSLAGGYFGPELRKAGVDMLIVGDGLKKGAISRIVKTMEAEIGKELVFASFETADFHYRLGMYDKLIRDILDYPHQKLLDKLNIKA